MLIDRERGPQAPPLRHIAKADPRDLRRRAADEFLSHETDRAAGDREQTDYRVAQRRLSHPVASDQRKHAVLERQIHALKGVAAAVEDVEPLDLQKVGRATFSHGRPPNTVPVPRGPPRSRSGSLP